MRRYLHRAMGTVYSMPEFEKRVGVPACTLRSWVRKKLLPAPRGIGRGARYTDDHVRRARLIQRFRGEKKSLRHIASYLRRLEPAELGALLASVDQTALPVVAPHGAETAPRESATTKPPLRWSMWLLEDGVVLMVNTAASVAVQRRAEQACLDYTRRMDLARTP